MPSALAFAMRLTAFGLDRPIRVVVDYPKARRGTTQFDSVAFDVFYGEEQAPMSMALAIGRTWTKQRITDDMLALFTAEIQYAAAEQGYTVGIVPDEGPETLTWTFHLTAPSLQ